MSTKTGCEDSIGYRKYLWLIPIIFLLTGVLAILLNGRRKSPIRSSTPLLLDEVTSASIPAAADDLTLIEGIGPKVATVLNANGIRRFQQVADFPATELKRLLIAAGNRLSDPTTWPEQAAIAASGNWEGLKALQSSLKRGRRTG